MNNQAGEKTYIEETITVIRPTTSNHIFNESRYEKIETYDGDGGKTVLLREKETFCRHDKKVYANLNGKRWVGCDTCKTIIGTEELPK